MIVYIAGPITGVFDYKEKFKAAEQCLKEMGHLVINPAILPNGLTDYMPTCKAMIDQVDALYVLEKHENSKGTAEEIKYARTKKKKIIYQVVETKGRDITYLITENSKHAIITPV